MRDRTERPAEPNWMVVMTTSSITEAAMMVERLQSLSIPAILHNEPIGSVLAAGVFGEARVLVPESYFDAAQGLFDPPDEDDALLLDLADDPDYDE